MMWMGRGGKGKVGTFFFFFFFFFKKWGEKRILRPNVYIGILEKARCVRKVPAFLRANLQARRYSRRKEKEKEKRKEKKKKSKPPMSTRFLLADPAF